MIDWIQKGIPLIETSLGREELSEQLRNWEPWSCRIDFSNGISTKDFQHRTPFVEHPLNKLKVAGRSIPFADFVGGRVLDIGCNVGYNSIALAATYCIRCVGVDVAPRNLERARFLTDIAQVDAEFVLESAEIFARPGEFDVVLHFGTLYHLQNPLLSLRLAFDNLRAGGYLALETQVYDHPDDPNICYFMHMQNRDQTNFWALSTNVLETSLRLIGFEEIRNLKKTVPALGLAKYMSRLLLVARRPAAEPPALTET
jgi:2-polyprenyl-3-methyl-5-hydroxy-6-metoxy-1,4-benzoquinol methylase